MEKILTILTVFVIVIVGLIFMAKRDEKYDLSQKQIKMNREHNNIPMNANTVICKELNGEYYNDHIPFSKNTGRIFEMWIENNSINLCEPYNEYKYKYPKIGGKKTIIDCQNIKFFTREGEYRVDNIVEGGGVSVGGALVGGVIAGGAGAILGGRKKITTTTKEVDKRLTYLYYVEDNQDKRIIFTSKTYDVLLEVIPNKYFGYIEKNKIVQSSNTKQSNGAKENTVYKDIEELAKLKDKGILTEEEFNEKKKILLEKII